MNLIIRIMYELLSVWEQYKADKKRLERDREIRKLKKDPANWYRNHFGGVRDVSGKADTTDKTGSKPD